MRTSIVFMLLSIVVPQLVRGQNLALGRPARQSSTWKIGNTADQAVDGNGNLDFGHGSCTKTACSDADPYWVVCLGATYEITSIKIANPIQAYGRFRNIDIEVFAENPIFGGASTLCGSVSGTALPDNRDLTFDCATATYGKYVRIRKTSDDGGGYGCGNALLLCEVEVTGTTYIECGDGFELFQGSCYHVSHTALDSWFEARKACNAIGADLVIITSLAENDYVHSQLMTNNPSRYWIGATNFLLGGDQYQWLDFTPIPLNGGGSNGFEDWDETINEPDFTTTMKCVSTLFDSGDFDWRTWQCSNNLPYVCEKSPTWPKPCDQGC